MIKNIMILILLLLLIFTWYKTGKLVIATKAIIRKLAKEANVDVMKIFREVGLK